MDKEKLKLAHTAARRLAMILDNKSKTEVEALDINYHVLNVLLLKKNKYYDDLKIIFDHLNLLYDVIIQLKTTPDDTTENCKSRCNEIIMSCKNIRKLKNSSSDDLFNHNIDELITNAGILLHEFEKISPSIPTSESKQEVLPFDLELENSKDLNEAIEKYEKELRSLNTTIWNLKNADPSVINPKVELLESYHHQMARINKTDITNVDIGTLQLKRVNFKLKNSEGRDAKIKDENMIHAQASSRPILGAILLTGAVLLGLTSIALCLTIKLAPIGLVGLALATKLFMAGTTMTALGLGGTSAYFFSAKTDLTKKTERTLQKLSVIQTRR